MILTTEKPESFGAFAVIGICLWVLGFAIEVVADQQRKLSDVTIEMMGNSSALACGHGHDILIISRDLALDRG